MKYEFHKNENSDTLQQYGFTKEYKCVYMCKLVFICLYVYVSDTFK